MLELTGDTRQVLRLRSTIRKGAIWNCSSRRQGLRLKYISKLCCSEIIWQIMFCCVHVIIPFWYNDHLCKHASIQYSFVYKPFEEEHNFGLTNSVLVRVCGRHAASNFGHPHRTRLCRLLAACGSWQGCTGASGKKLVMWYSFSAWCVDDPKFVHVQILMWLLCGWHWK